MTSSADEQFGSVPSEGQADAAPTPPARWYAVQVASGCENRVKATLEQRIQTFDVANRILQVEIPQTPTVKLKKDGTRQTAEEKVFPAT
jgi:transcriptional antiterminator NusG